MSKEAFKRYLDDCGKHAIVPGVAGAFYFAWQEALAQPEQGEPVAWACWLDSQNPETDKPVVVQYEPLAYSKRRPLIYTTPKQPNQEQGEPVAWAGYNLDDMCEAFDRVIEEHYGRKTPFHDPVNRDAMLALRILRGFVPYMKRYITPQQRKPLTDEQKDAARYRWLFNDVDLAAIKDAFDKQKAPPANLHSAVIEQIIGFYTDKQSADMTIDAAIEAAHGIKE